MFIINITDEYNDLIKCTDIEKFIDRIVPTSLLTIPYGLSFLCLKSVRIYTIKPLITNK